MYWWQCIVQARLVGHILISTVPGNYTVVAVFQSAADSFQSEKAIDSFFSKNTSIQKSDFFLSCTHPCDFQQHHNPSTWSSDTVGHPLLPQAKTNILNPELQHMTMESTFMKLYLSTCNQPNTKVEQGSVSKGCSSWIRKAKGSSKTEPSQNDSQQPS